MRARVDVLGEDRLKVQVDGADSLHDAIAHEYELDGRERRLFGLALWCIGVEALLAVLTRAHPRRYARRALLGSAGRRGSGGRVRLRRQRRGERAHKLEGISRGISVGLVLRLNQVLLNVGHVEAAVAAEAHVSRMLVHHLFFLGVGLDLRAYESVQSFDRALQWWFKQSPRLSE